VKNSLYKKGFNTLKNYFSEYKSQFISLSLLGLFSALLGGFLPYIVGRLLDAILSPAMVFAGTSFQMPIWLFLIIIWFLIKIIEDVMGKIIYLKGDLLSEKIHLDYIVNGFSNLLEFPISFHKNIKLGEVTDKISRAANNLDRIAGEIFIDLLPQFLTIIVAAAITFYVNWILALLLVVGVVIYTVILFRVAPRLARVMRKSNGAYGKAFGFSFDSLFNITSVKQAVSEKHEQRKIFKNFKLKAFGFWSEMISIWHSVGLYQRVIITFSQLAIFAISVFMIQKGQMTIGELVMFNGYAGMFFGPFARLGRNWQLIQNGFITLERSEKVLKTNKEKYIPENAVVLSDIKGSVEFKNVFFSYKKKDKDVLKNISFSVEPGQKIALVGESGVGKSTLVELVSGYYFATGGQVLIDGHNAKNLDLKFLRSKIAVVPQEVVLFHDTIANNIKYGNFGVSDRRMKLAADKSHCLEFIENFPKKWKSVVGERGIKLSVGQKQRVAIARAILRDPRILILDEPTSALDAKSEKIIQGSLDKLMEDRTTFIIAHRLSTVRKADKILVLDKGEIIESGTHDELVKKKNGAYRQLYELQIGLK
jgi:ATP-binding cassette subfamily B protein/subfamily B ATP-binding cassette protein MsbA